MSGPKPGTEGYARRIETTALDDELQWFEQALNVVHAEFKDASNPSGIPPFVCFPNFANLCKTQKDKVFDIWQTLCTILMKAKSYNKRAPNAAIPHVKEETERKTTLLTQDDIQLGSDSYISIDGLMGAQLHVSDKDIAELSDVNRPTKIAERFSHLYDDLWTDAFQVQTDRFKRSEKEAVTRLLEMLKDARQFCVETADLHTNKVLDELLTFGNDSKRNTSSSGKPLNIHVLSETQRKQFHELRRLTVDYTIEHLQDMFFAYIKKEKKYDMRESPPYLEKCVELCWYMVLQDPPIQIQFEPTTQPGSPFRPEEYTFYSKSGKKLAYIVWPPLRLKKGGEILAKGVAQSM